MSSRTSKRFVLVAQPVGMPKLSDFKIIEESLPELKDGEILTKADWLTVDPYMRGRLRSLTKDQTIIGQQVATVLESRNSKYPVGSKVVASFGWRDLTVYKPSENPSPLEIYQLPDFKGLPESYALGSVGMPGNTALFGIEKILELKGGQTLVVSAAAGAVGSLVGQIGKIKGCTVLGFAGTEDKVKWLKDDLGFDHVFNYKTVNVAEVLKTHAPKGVDRYFDNVGGEFTANVMPNMVHSGRIALCGAISIYNSEGTGAPTVPFDYMSMIYKNVRMEGFIVYDYAAEWQEGLKKLRDWILEGKLKVQETVSKGFETMPQAFIDLLQGKNVGKQIIQA